MTRNKARLVGKRYNQKEGMDFDETFAPVARLEVVLILCAFASYMGIRLFQTDVKCTFSKCFLNEVYMEPNPGFESSKFSNHVFNFHKTLYGLNQAPRA